MALTPKLEMRQGQQLVMTPQLQQAIRLLQMSRMELVESVRQELLENPVLEDQREKLEDDLRYYQARIKDVTRSIVAAMLSFAGSAV